MRPHASWALPYKRCAIGVRYGEALLTSRSVGDELRICLKTSGRIGRNGESIPRRYNGRHVPRGTAAAMPCAVGREPGPFSPRAWPTDCRHWRRISQRCHGPRISRSCLIPSPYYSKERRRDERRHRRVLCRPPAGLFCERPSSLEPLGGEEYQALCCFHEDSKPSLNINT